MFLKFMGMLFVTCMIIGFVCLSYVFYCSFKGGKVKEELTSYFKSHDDSNDNVEDFIIKIFTLYTYSVGYCIRLIKKTIKK